MTRLDRRLLFTSGAAAALLAATGVSAQPRPKRGGRLVAALSGASRSDRWGEAEGLFMQAAQGAVFETLTEIAADGTLRADVAAGWHSADGGMTWIFELGENVMFHDAQPLMPEDVATLFSRHDVLDVKSVQIVSDRRIAVTLNAANPSLPYTLADPQFVVLPASEARQEAGIGTGLYRLQKFQAGRQFIGARVEQHRKDAQAGWFDQVEFVSIPSASVRAEALRDGLIDVADVDALDPYADANEFQFLPSGQSVQQIARRSVQVPVTIGEVWPLDNMRMAQRWWSA